MGKADPQQWSWKNHSCEKFKTVRGCLIHPRVYSGPQKSPQTEGARQGLNAYLPSLVTDVRGPSDAGRRPKSPQNWAIKEWGRV